MRRLAVRLRSESGHTLPELLTVVGLLPVVLGAALTTATGFDGVVRRNQELNEAQARTREGIDQLARDLRNLASPTPQQPRAVDSAGPYDLVFQSVDPSGPGAAGNPANVRRVRYCLDLSGGGRATLWAQSQTWTTATPPAVPSTAQCPDPAWPEQRRLAGPLTNRVDGNERPLFQFNSSDVTQINSVVVSTWVRSGEGREPADALLRTQVFLRNQNQAPVSRPTATSTGLLRVVLNGSASYDPEGQELTYEWYAGAEYLGSGIVLESVLANAGVHEITLRVQDPAGLEAVATTQVEVWSS